MATNKGYGTGTIAVAFKQRTKKGRKQNTERDCLLKIHFLIRWLKPNGNST